MATMSLTITLAGISDAATSTWTEGEQFATQSEVTGAAVEKTLGFLSTPKGIACFGNDGISIRTAAAGQDLQANPFAAINNTNAGWAQTSVWLSSAAGTEIASVIAAE